MLTVTPVCTNSNTCCPGIGLYARTRPTLASNQLPLGPYPSTKTSRLLVKPCKTLYGIKSQGERRIIPKVCGTSSQLLHVLHNETPEISVFSAHQLKIPANVLAIHLYVTLRYSKQRQFSQLKVGMRHYMPFPVIVPFHQEKALRLEDWQLRSF